MIYNVIIIGGGCAGLSAAIYTARAMLSPLVFADTFDKNGGLLMKTSSVENYPGFPSGINGFDLISEMSQQAINHGAKIISEEVISVDLSKKPYEIQDSNKNIYQTHSIIICTGSNPNRLGLPNEDIFWSKGISSCAVCDGALYKNKNIVVVGGGDSAMEEALFLTKFSDVILIHRRNEFRASKIMQERLLNNPKIKIIYDTIISELVGTDTLNSIICTNLKNNEKMSISVDGLFYGLGLTPNSNLFRNQIDIDDDGYIIKKENANYDTMTSIEGVFVAGDVSDKKYKQAIVACGDGCKAALDVEKYLSFHVKNNI